MFGLFQRNKGQRAFSAYLTEVEHALTTLTRGTVVERILASEGLPDHVPPHAIADVTMPGQEAARLIATIGFGRAPQPGARTEDENERVELTTYTDEAGAETARLALGMLGILMINGAGGAAWNAYDTVTFPEPIRGHRAFVFRPGGRIGLRRGPTITLLAVVPITDREHDQAKGGRARAWLESQMSDPERRSDFVRRWARGA